MNDIEIKLQQCKDDIAKLQEERNRLEQELERSKDDGKVRLCYYRTRPRVLFKVTNDIAKAIGRYIALTPDGDRAMQTFTTAQELVHNYNYNNVRILGE